MAESFLGIILDALYLFGSLVASGRGNILLTLLGSVLVYVCASTSSQGIDSRRLDFWLTS